jgi:hypothetical protein
MQSCRTCASFDLLSSTMEYIASGIYSLRHAMMHHDATFLQPNFSPCVGSHLPSCGGPFEGLELPDVVGTPPNLIPTSGVHMPDGGGAALVGVGAVNGASACAFAPYCGFCASACRCCCNELEFACWRLKELIRVARSLYMVSHDSTSKGPVVLTPQFAMLPTCADTQNSVHHL